MKGKMTCCSQFDWEKTIWYPQNPKEWTPHLNIPTQLFSPPLFFRFVISNFTPIIFIEISFVYPPPQAKATPGLRPADSLYQSALKKMAPGVAPPTTVVMSMSDDELMDRYATSSFTTTTAYSQQPFVWWVVRVISFFRSYLVPTRARVN